MIAACWDQLTVENDRRTPVASLDWHRFLLSAADITVGPSSDWLPILEFDQTEAIPTKSEPAVCSLEFKWLARAIELGPDRHDVDNISDLFVEIDRALHSSHFRLLGQTIKAIPVDAMSPPILVSLLRATAAARTELPGWSQVLTDVRAVLERRGLDSRKLLRGVL